MRRNRNYQKANKVQRGERKAMQTKKAAPQREETGWRERLGPLLVKRRLARAASWNLKCIA